MVLISIPFLAGRVVSALLTTFAYEGSTFGQVQPNVVTLALLQFFMEFLVVFIFPYIGLILFPSKVKTTEGSQVLPDEPCVHFHLQNIYIQVVESRKSFVLFIIIVLPPSVLPCMPTRLLSPHTSLQLSRALQITQFR